MRGFMRAFAQRSLALAGCAAALAGQGLAQPAADTEEIVVRGGKSLTEYGRLIGKARRK
jgi:hypothetical protein